MSDVTVTRPIIGPPAVMCH